MPTEIWVMIGTVAAAFFGSSWIGEVLKGRLNNKTIDEKLNQIKKLMNDSDDNINKRMDSLDSKIETLEYKVDKNDAENRRYRVLRLSKESNTRDLDEEELNNAIEDIHIYEQFCHDHEKFENGKATRAIENIRYLDRVRREGKYKKHTTQA